MRLLTLALVGQSIVVLATLLQVGGLCAGQSGTAKGLVTVGLSGADKVGSDEVPFNDAISVLPAGGGTIIVFAGTYSFKGKVLGSKPIRVICQPGVVIERDIGSSYTDELFEFNAPSSSLVGARIQLSSSDVGVRPVIQVAADQFELSEVTIVDERTVEGRQLVRISEGDDITVTRCRFDITAEDQAPHALDYVMISLGQADTTEDFTRLGAFIHGNVFAVNDGQENESVIAIRSENARATRITGNQFRSKDPKAVSPLSPAGRIRMAVYLVDELGAVISDNTFRFLGEISAVSSSLAEAIVRVENTQEEGPGCVIVGNFMETCQAVSCIDLVGARQCTIVGNVFGRGMGAVRLTNNSLGQETRDIVMLGNQIHNLGNSLIVSGPQVVPTVIEHSRNVSVVGNQFTLCHTTPLVEVSGTVDNTVLSSNQFVLGDATVNVSSAILIAGGVGHLAHDNSALKNATNGYVLVVDATAVAGSDKSVDNNYSN